MSDMGTTPALSPAAHRAPDAAPYLAAGSPGEVSAAAPDCTPRRSLRSTKGRVGSSSPASTPGAPCGRNRPKSLVRGGAVEVGGALADACEERECERVRGSGHGAPGAASHAHAVGGREEALHECQHRAARMSQPWHPSMV
jgi:hypothetical protein